ncbi:conserved hypothetical protein [Hyella patelloides LEGE 07179]|uniref:Thiol-disulfide oxidoreductase n=1 Tax=Hyella patelloides LEGE 07179 TaxID=945734 RepID=A0A563VX37_9CYAN|nr:DCC1-like thiol-disulfide oxidoreductase family protein [Hyella patelloides]VEP16024.1 conserved hypothetical protein [Hyella patelloides LEGE 07179]
MNYHVIYDGNCNLCVTFTKLLAKFDRGQIFDYVPMQDEATLEQFDITDRDCQMGMILIDGQQTERRWQGSSAAEEIGRLLPLGDAFVAAYRSIPGMKWIGDRTYEQVRDNRYSWFGKTESTYYSDYPFGCNDKS